ncbi:SCAN domain-containing protein 3 [Habropoda laboriosa]|uniref:SCAN domain-containing protein 3 n=1 Tax=Habropoda laboriosa TaxID=597456 RepID=A0A0L7QV99_9HYME|nr:SCAN domain-containing protein 3 [Habropoda laboriosa]
MNSYYNITNKRLYYRGQIDIIDMPMQLTSNYKYFLVYEDQTSRFVVLKGLHGNTANEVALKLLDILAIIGAPQVLQSNNGRKFAKEVVQELRLLCKDFIILHGEISQNKEQNRDFKNLLERWVEKNPTKTWYEAVKYIQIFQNSTFRSENGKIPYDILFGRNVHEDFEKRINTIDSAENIWTEEEWISLMSNGTDNVKKESDEQHTENLTFTDNRDVDSVSITLTM